MKLRATSSKLQYAVILASSTHDSSELLVLAYAGEKPLRSLIADPSIIALGFTSRSEAEAAVAGRLRQSVATQQPRVMSARKNGYQRISLVLHFSTRRLTDVLTHWKSHSVVYRAVQFTVVTAVLIFYSRNIVSSTIRTALGA